MNSARGWLSALLAVLLIVSSGMHLTSRAQSVVPGLSVKVEQAFQSQDFESVIRLLEPALKDASTLDARQRVRFLERLGACYWLTDQKEAARSTFARLWQDEYEHNLDELVYPAQLISFYDNERRRLKALGFIGVPRSEQPGSTGEPQAAIKTLVRTVTLNRAPAIAYWMPFGVGQFANQEQGLGTAMAVLQGIGLLGNVATWISVEALKTEGSLAAERAGQAELLQGLWIGSTAVFLLAYGYSVLDGLLSRPPARVVSEEESTSWKIRVAPASEGIGLGLGGVF